MKRVWLITDKNDRTIRFQAAETHADSLHRARETGAPQACYSEYSSDYKPRPGFQEYVHV